MTYKSHAFHRREVRWRLRSAVQPLSICAVSIIFLSAGSRFSFAQKSLPLNAGAARVDITGPLAPGWENVTGKYGNEHVYARAIVIDNGAARAALIGTDQANLSEAVWQNASVRVAKDLNCPPSNIIMSATHTHSAGVGMPLEPPKPGEPLSADDQRIADGIVKAVDEAKTKLEPAKMVWGTGQIDLNSNRDAIDPESHLWTQAPNTNAPSDKTVAVLAFERLSGPPIGVYVNYPMHAINGYLTNFISGDFPGAMSRWVEEAFDDKAIAIFTQGASGDQNPLYLRPSTNAMASRSGAPIDGFEAVRESVEEPLRDEKVQGKPLDPVVRDRLQQWMQSEGIVLGEVAIRAITHPTDIERNASIVGQQSDVTCPGRVRTDSGAHVSGGPTPFVIGVPGTFSDGPAIPIRVGVLAIGNVALTSVDAEIYTLIGQRIKRESPMANTMVVTIADGRAPSGYIPDDASFSHNTFQVLASHLKVGCAEQQISATTTKMIDNYESGRR